MALPCGDVLQKLIIRKLFVNSFNRQLTLSLSAAIMGGFFVDHILLILCATFNLTKALIAEHLE